MKEAKAKEAQAWEMLEKGAALCGKFVKMYMYMYMCP